MRTKKLIGIALVAALVSSMTAMSVNAGRMQLDGAEEYAGYTSNHKFGVVGSITGWADGNDIPMTDDDKDGVYEAVFKTTLTADQMVKDGDEIKDEIMFKVRADGKWDDSWGLYEDEEGGRTMNSQTNCVMSASVGETIVVKVTLDTNYNPETQELGDGRALPDDERYGLLWPVTFEKMVDVKAAVEAALGDDDDYHSYYFFDNSQTKYNTVGAFWWDDADIKAGDWPGTEAVQIEGTDIWGMKVAFENDAAHIIFNNLVSDADYSTENPKAQTEDINVTVSENLGQVWTPDMSTEKVTEEGAVKKVNGTWGKLPGDGAYELVFPKPEPVVSDPVVSDPVESKPESTPGTDKKTSTRDMYIYFDNSETKFEEVYAYWWEHSYARTYDFENNDWGCVAVTNEDGSQGYNPTAFPGTKMTQIPDTDIWQVRIPYGAEYVIFNSGVSDAQLESDKEIIAYQSADLNFDAAVNAGQIYKVEVDSAKPGRGDDPAPRKITYKKGAWSAYEGAFVEEEYGEVSLPESEPTSESDPSSESGGTTGGDTPYTPSGNGTDVPSTGEVVMGVGAVAVAVAAAALGAVVLAARKKEEV